MSILAFLFACAPDAPAPVDTGSAAPEVNAVSAPFAPEGSTVDEADGDCRVVLRTARRRLASWGGGYETVYGDDGRSWTSWEIQADFDAALLDEGARPGLMFEVNGSGIWWEIRSEGAADGEVASGMARQRFLIDEEGLPSDQAPPLCPGGRHPARSGPAPGRRHAALRPQPAHRSDGQLRPGARPELDPPRRRHLLG